MDKFNRYRLQVFAMLPLSTLDWNQPMVMCGVDVLMMLIGLFVSNYAWQTLMSELNSDELITEPSLAAASLVAASLVAASGVAGPFRWLPLWWLPL